MALYFLFEVTLFWVRDVVVFATSVQTKPPSVEYCHLVMFPECPLKVSVTVFVPEQEEVLEMVPPTGGVPWVTVTG